LSGIQPILGIAFLVLGTIHFINRDREPGSRSMFVGAMASNYRARMGFAFVETAVGLILLLTS
jgi:hypothetical protein